MVQGQADGKGHGSLGFVRIAPGLNRVDGAGRHPSALLDPRGWRRLDLHAGIVGSHRPGLIQTQPWGDRAHEPMGIRGALAFDPGLELSQDVGVDLAGQGRKGLPGTEAVACMALGAGRQGAIGPVALGGEDPADGR